jgi:hypothetical protein
MRRPARAHEKPQLLLALSSLWFERQNRVVEWDVKVISRPFYIPKWDVSTSEPAEIPAEWKVFFR